MDSILVTELAAHLATAPDIEPGCLCVFEDYKGRMVTAKVRDIMVDGLGRSLVSMTVAGLEPVQHGLYRIGDLIVRDRQFVRRAI